MNFCLKSRKNMYPLRESTSVCMSTSFKEQLKTLFFKSFKKFFLDSKQKFIEKHLKTRKKVENGQKKYFDQLSGAHTKIQKTQQKTVMTHFQALLSSSHIFFQIILACIWLASVSLAIPQAVAFRVVLMDGNTVPQCLPVNVSMGFFKA